MRRITTLLAAVGAMLVLSAGGVLAHPAQDPAQRLSDVRADSRGLFIDEDRAVEALHQRPGQGGGVSGSVLSILADEQFAGSQ